jgi:hypothetical protein
VTDDGPDSIFTWIFVASSGESWGGWLVEDSARFAAGASVVSLYGTYTILMEEERGLDLSVIGLDDGMIFVEWYRQGLSGMFLPTRNGGSVAAGGAGLGSEQDAAWNGVGWEPFGRGGVEQVRAVDPPDSLYGWVFVADVGDMMWGSIAEDTGTLTVGQSFRSQRGTYWIINEAPQGRDLGDARPEGSITAHRYRSAAGVDLTLESGGTALIGREGLGSEADRAWNGGAWVQVGLGGAAVAPNPANTLFSWVFEASGGGDIYAGWLVGAAGLLSVGATSATPYGSYRIYAAAPYGGTSPAGTVWVTDYRDAETAQWLTTEAYRVLGRPAGIHGLGSEYDRVWDGDEWDVYGHGGAFLATVEQPRRFSWYLQTDTGGDLYAGFLHEDAGRYRPGDSFRGNRGTYVIYDEQTTSQKLPNGTVWITDYFDGGSQTWMPTLSWQQGRPAATGGLGNEYDYAWDGTEWDDFGWGGIYQADAGPDGFFAWAFRADSGDIYAGWLSEDAARFFVGDTMRGASGTYEIYNKWPHPNPTGIRDGTLWITDYYDATSDRWLPTRSWGQNGKAASEWGIGNEYEYAWTGTAWVGFGVGGIHQIDLAPGSANLPPEPFPY